MELVPPVSVLLLVRPTSLQVIPSHETCLSTWTAHDTIEVIDDPVPLAGRDVLVVAKPLTPTSPIVEVPEPPTGCAGALAMLTPVKVMVHVSPMATSRFPAESVRIRKPVDASGAPTVKVAPLQLGLAAPRLLVPVPLAGSVKTLLSAKPASQGKKLVTCPQAATYLSVVRVTACPLVLDMVMVKLMPV